jgi:hypothetical protein
MADPMELMNRGEMDPILARSQLELAGAPMPDITAWRTDINSQAGIEHAGVQPNGLRKRFWTKIAGLGVVAGSLVALPGALATANSGSTGTPMAAGADQTFKDQPDSIDIVNLTATESIQGGWFQLRGANDAVGAFSNLNVDGANKTAATLGIVPTNHDGEASVHSQSGGQVIVDKIASITAGKFIPENKRILETRTNDQGGILPAGSMTVLHGTPYTVGIVNFVATNVVNPGFVEVLPCVGEAPGARSSLNADHANQTVNNPTLVRYGADGTACVYNQQPMALVGDSQGNFSGDALDTSIPPSRLLDTRTTGLVPSLGAKVIVRGLPDREALINITSIDSLSGGYVQAETNGALAGSSSNVNTDQAGQTRSNMAVVRFGHDGALEFYDQNGSNLAVDLLSYANPGTFNIITPQRLVDTRNIVPVGGGTTTTTTLPPVLTGSRMLSYQDTFAVPSKQDYEVSLQTPVPCVRAANGNMILSSHMSVDMTPGSDTPDPQNRQVLVTLIGEMNGNVIQGENNINFGYNQTDSNGVRAFDEVTQKVDAIKVRIDIKSPSNQLLDSKTLDYPLVCR